MVTSGRRCMRLVDAEHRCSASSERLNCAAVFFEQGDYLARGIDRLDRGVPYAGQEEFHPRFPRAVFTDFLKQAIVVEASRFEVEAQIQDRFAQRSRFAQRECDQQTSQAPVSIKERVDSLELRMRQTRLDQRRQLWIVRMQKLFERVEAFIQPVRRRWDEQGVARARAPNPVLRAAKLTGLLAGATSGLE